MNYKEVHEFLKRVSRERDQDESEKANSATDIIAKVQSESAGQLDPEFVEIIRISHGFGFDSGLRQGRRPKTPPYSGQL